MLCSATKTFAVKNVETTNLVLLVQEETAVCSASGAPAALTSQDPNVQPTPPGAVGLATQLHKVGEGMADELLVCRMWQMSRAATRCRTCTTPA